MTNLLSIRNVSKTFSDGTHALGPIDLDVGRGEFLAIVGPSGCGKSTMLRIAAGLDSPTTGSTVVDLPSVGYVFQDPTLLPWRTLEANVRLFGELRKLSQAELNRDVAAALSMVGLSDFADKYPTQLSGGMKMRASLARSLVVKPSIFFFDEPFGALDEITRERLNDELRTIFLAMGFAGLFVTHSVAEAVYLSTRVLVMSDRPGRITHSFDVPFGSERNHDLRFDPEFTGLCRKVSQALRGTSR